MALSFATDIRPLFRDDDVDCMKPIGVDLDDPVWMCVPANAQRSTARLRMARCLRGSLGRPIVCRFSKSGWTRGTRHGRLLRWGSLASKWEGDCSSAR